MNQISMASLIFTPIEIKIIFYGIYNIPSITKGAIVYCGINEILLIKSRLVFHFSLSPLHTALLLYHSR